MELGKWLRFIQCMYILLVYICLLWTFHMRWKWLLSIFHSNALIMELKKEEWLCLLKNLSRKIINERLEDWWMWKFDLNCQENSSLWFLLFRPLSWCKLITGPLVISKIKTGLWVYNIEIPSYCLLVWKVYVCAGSGNFPSGKDLPEAKPKKAPP